MAVMASLRTPTLRHFLVRPVPFLRFAQRRWAQVHDVHFVATHRQYESEIVEKYKQKLEQKAKDAGVKDIDELKRLARETSQSQKPTHTSPFPPPPPPPRISSDQSTSLHSPIPKNTGPPGIKTLSSFLDVPRTLALPPKEIEAIWRLRHASSPQSLCASIPYSIYRELEIIARQHPQFILPLPRPGQGAEIHFLQWTFPSPTTSTVLFTHLAEYKLRGEYAAPHTTVTHHTELAKDKGLVLLQGTVVEGRGVSPEDGRWLVMWLQRFYGGVGDKDDGKGSRGRRRKLLEGFSKGEEGWRVEDVVEEVEKIV